MISTIEGEIAFHPVHVSLSREKRKSHLSEISFAATLGFLLATVIISSSHDGSLFVVLQSQLIPSPFPPTSYPPLTSLLPPSLLLQKPEPDFELLLQQISSAILDKQQRLSEIKLRERRATLLFTLYAFGLWVLYAGLWWLDWLPLGLLAGLLRGENEGYEMDEDSVGWERGLAGVLVVGAPAVVGPFW
jgi:hypothetical protein